jgi:hypothetical protein
MKILCTLVVCLLIRVSTSFTLAATNDVSRTACWLATTYAVALQEKPVAPVTVVTNNSSEALASPGGTNTVGGSNVERGDFSLETGLDYRRAFGDDYSSYSQLRLSLERAFSERNAASVFVSAGLLELEEGSRVRAAAHTPLVLGFGVGFRHYLTRQHTFLRPYFTADVSFLWMTWGYKEDQQSGGETVSSDSLEGMDAYVGMGLLVGSNKRVNLFGEIGAGGVAFLGTTDRELKNELFSDFGYVGIKAGLRFRF